MDPLRDGSIPNWAMLGIFSGGRYFIYASDELSMVKLEQEFANDEPSFADFAAAVTIPAHTYYTRLKMRMRTYHIGIGYSYNEALRNLMGHWNPDDKKVKEISR